MSDLKGRIAVITGAARGMGAEFAARIAREGADVVVVDILDSNETIAAVQAAGVRGIAVKADITSPEAMASLAEGVKRDLGPIHILINNAGLHPHPTAFEELTFDYWRKTMAVNLDSMFLTIQAFLPQMKENGWGRIINMSSAAANAAPPMGAPYVASKTGVVGLTRAVAAEVGKYEITCNAIAPNPVRTPGAEGGAVSEEMFQQIAAAQPVPRVMLPADVAGVIAFLCTRDAAFITGQHLHVDGGMIRGD